MKNNKRALSTLINTLSVLILSLISVSVLFTIIYMIIDTQSTKINDDIFIVTTDGNEANINLKKSYSDPLVQINSLNGLVSWWRFEDNNQDIIQNNHGNCKKNNCPLFIDSGSNIRKKAVLFDGKDDFIYVKNNPSLNIDGKEITFLAWVKSEGQFYDNSSAGGIIINKESSYELGIRAINNGKNSNKTQWALVGPTGKYFKDFYPYVTSWAWHITPGIVPTNEWIHIAVSYKYPYVDTYHNGVLVEHFNVVPDAFSQTIIPSEYDMGIGARPHESKIWKSFFNGSIDEVMIFNRSLTYEEIKLIYDLTNK